MSSVNSRTFPKPLIVKNYANGAITPNVYQTLFTIPVPAGTAYQFAGQSSFAIDPSAGSEANSVILITQVNNTTIPTSNQYLRYESFSDLNITADTAGSVPIGGLIYNSSDEEVLVQFRAYVLPTAGGMTFDITSEYPTVLFWEVPIVGYKVLA